MDIFDYGALEATPLRHDPFDHLVVAGFVRPDSAAAIGRDYPRIDGVGSHPLDRLCFGAAFGSFWSELQSDGFRRRFERKFGVPLAGHPLMATAREFVHEADGAIHTDSKTKVVTLLFYFNESWSQEGGRLRILRSAHDLEDFAVEVSPLAGTLVAFRRSERSFHGHRSASGHRRTVQVHWVSPKRVTRNPEKRRTLRWRVKKLLRLG
jgi:SM-20-related protein